MSEYETSCFADSSSFEILMEIGIPLKHFNEIMELISRLPNVAYSLSKDIDTGDIRIRVKYVCP